MVWIDRLSQKQVERIRDHFDIQEYIETGTFKGVNAEFQSRFFNKVTTVESNVNYYLDTAKRLRKLSNVQCDIGISEEFLRKYKSEYERNKRKDIVLFFLDAHYYNHLATTQKERWVLHSVYR